MLRCDTFTNRILAVGPEIGGEKQVMEKLQEWLKKKIVTEAYPLCAQRVSSFFSNRFLNRDKILSMFSLNE